MSQSKLTPIAPTARKPVVLFALVLALLAFSSPAMATSYRLPGISLEDLVDGTLDGFDSRNGELTFTDFSADTSGIAPHKLKYYRLVPLGDGFRLYAPLVGLFGHDAGLDLDYRVEADEGLLIERVKVTLAGAALLGRSKATAEISDLGGDPLGDLEVKSRKFFFFGKTHDQTSLSRTVSEILMSEDIDARAGLFSSAFKLDHHFKTQLIPEPTTALLMGLGLLGLAIAGRRR